MLDVLQKEMPEGVRWVVPQGGLYYWVRVPEKVTSGMKSRLFQTALRKQVLYVPGELCYVDDPARSKPNHEMRLSFGAESETLLMEGIKRLAAAIMLSLARRG